MATLQGIGREMRLAREAAGLSRPELARRVNSHRATIDRLELEDSLPNALTFAAIARELRVSVDDVLGVKVG